MDNTAALLSTAEVAKAAGKTASAVSRWVTAGKLTPVYKGEGLRGFYLFDPAQVEAFLQERTLTDSDS